MSWNWASGDLIRVTNNAQAIDTEAVWVARW